MASIREVAKKAGVATCTVSRVLNGTAPVATETKEKIERAMQELDYIPNELARGMFRQKSGIVAMLVSSIRHPFFSSLAEFIEKDLYKQGYKLMLCSTSNEVEKETEYLKFFKSNLVDGVIMAVNNLHKKDYEEFKKPLVMLDYYVDDNTPLVVSDHIQGGLLAASEFIKNKRKYILHICDEIEPENIVSYQSHLKLDELLKKNGIISRSINVNWNIFDIKEYEGFARTIFEHYPNIDGIMCADMVAVAFLNVALEMGIKIPEDLNIISYDGTYVVDMAQKKLTTIIQPIEQISRNVVDIMVKKFDGYNIEDMQIKLPVSLEKGNTT